MPVVGRGRGKFVLGKSKIFANSASTSSNRSVPNESTATDVWGTTSNNTNNDQFADPDKEVEIKFMIYNSNIARVIGKKGATIIAIREDSSAEINIDKESSGDKSEVTLKGSQRNVAEARRLIDDICRKFNGICDEDSVQTSSMPGDDGPSTEEDIWIPEDKCGRVIGSRGSKIQEIQDSSGANVKVHGRETAEGGKVKVTIGGTPSQIDNAKTQIQTLTKDRDGPSFRLPDDAETLEILVRSGRLGRLIGKGGSKMKEIQELYSIRIDIQKNEIRGEDTVVLLAGSPSSTAKAHEFIDELVERAQDLSLGDNNEEESWDTAGSTNNANTNDNNTWDTSKNNTDSWNTSGGNGATEANTVSTGGWDSTPSGGGWDNTAETDGWGPSNGGGW